MSSVHTRLIPARSVSAAAVAVAAMFALGACGGSSADTPSATAGAPDYSYLDDVDDNGLINGMTYEELTTRETEVCMAEAGWEVLPDGGYHVADEQADQWTADAEKCAEQINVRYPIPPESEEQARRRYALEVETRDCLNAQGYSLSEPPSEQAWIDVYYHGASGELWLPYFELFSTENIDATLEAELKEKCPDPASRFY